MQPSGHVEVSSRLLSAMLREREFAPRAALLAQQAAELISGGAAVVYVLNAGKSPSNPSTWTGKATAGEILLDDPTVPADSGILGTLAQEQRPLLFSGNELTREDYAHLHARRTLVSLACIPIIVNDVLFGALEVASFEGMIDSSDVQILVDLVEHAGAGLVTGMLYEDERNSLLESVSRLTQLYDLEKVFSSTLEMAELQPLITSKIREVLDVQAVNLWFVKDQNELLLMQQSGNDPTAAVGSSQRTGEGYITEVSDSNEPLLIVGDKDDVKDERLAQRNASGVDGGPFSVVVCPLVAHEKQVGIIEAINKTDGSPFDEDDLFLLNAISETAAIALNNAGLLQAERKVEILQALVQVSGEITSTLNLDRVLQAVVNTPSAVIPYERASVALDERGKLRLKAVSGMEQINPGAREITQLENVIPAVSGVKDAVFIAQRGDEPDFRIDAPEEAMKAPFRKYFSETGMRAFYALPLADDEGRLGILLFESSDPDFLGEAHLEMIRVLGGQATVAVRNASLYKEVPFIGILGPILQKKTRFLALEKRRRAVLMAGAAAVALFFAIFPIPMRVDGTSTVAPARTNQVQPEVDGVIRQVYVREGDHVQSGQVLADLEDWDYRAALAGAQAKYQTATMEMNRALAANDGAQAGIQGVQARYWASEVDRARQRLERTHLRALMDGWVTTPHVEDLTGRHLAAGDTFAEVADSSTARVDVAIDESEVSLLRPGAAAAIKVEGFPTHTFRGNVAVVSPKSQADGDVRLFYARVDVPNPDGRLRPGMQGRGKISVGWHPIGYVLFRSPFMWFYSKLWSWFGW
ncbi:MAG: efflux RND transporter periplasmic adaptor subunit [Terriglobales bacterium]